MVFMEVLVDTMELLDFTQVAMVFMEVLVDTMELLDFTQVAMDFTVQHGITELPDIMVAIDTMVHTAAVTDTVARMGIVGMDTVVRMGIMGMDTVAGTGIEGTDIMGRPGGGGLPHGHIFGL